jgi:murein L,D-transpeptidase YafK
MEKVKHLLKNGLLALFHFIFVGGILETHYLYASTSLPSSLVKLPENENAILVEKQSQTLYLYSSKNKGIFLEFKTDCSTGEASGIKIKAGDKKTPEGVYFLKDEYEDRYLTPIYGKKAFSTDYPNLLDARAGRNGSAIWIHGTNKKLKPMDSNGCVALENQSILKLSNYVNIDSTPVIMVENITENSKIDLNRQKQEVLETINGWLAALSKGSYHDYLSFYSPNYLPDINWWETWLKIRGQALKNKSYLKVSGEKIGIYRHNNLYVALLDYYLNYGNEKVKIGKRKLFIDVDKGTHKIIGDVFQTAEKYFSEDSAPLISAVSRLVKPVVKEESVIDIVNKWLHAWSSKEMEKYASFYAANFTSDGLNKKRWIARKKGLSKKYSNINVTGKNFKIKQRKDYCEVTFFQEYESSAFTTLGTKKLKLVKKGGLWKIYQENWEEK